MELDHQELQVGNKYHIGGMYYVIDQILEKNKKVGKVPIQTVRKVKAKKVLTLGGDTVLAFLFRETYFAHEDSGRNCIIQIYYERDTDYLDTEKIQRILGKQIGSTLETKGYEIFTLDEIHTIKKRPENHICYVWKSEVSIDYRGEIKKKENNVAKYIKDNLPQGTIITISDGTRYTVEQYLSGHSAFSTVFRATNNTHGNTVAAIKIQHKDAANHEADILNIFGWHENIVSLESIGSIEKYKHPNNANSNPFQGEINISNDDASIKTNLACLGVEYIDGHTLDFYAKGLRLGQAINLIRQIGNAVQYVHDLGYLHLDIKLQNIMVDDKGKPIIIDMGSVTEKNNRPFALGVGAYAAPETREYFLNFPGNVIFTSRLFQNTKGNLTFTGLLNSISASQEAFRKIAETADVLSG